MVAYGGIHLCYLSQPPFICVYLDFYFRHSTSIGDKPGPTWRPKLPFGLEWEMSLDDIRDQVAITSAVLEESDRFVRFSVDERLQSCARVDPRGQFYNLEVKPIESLIPWVANPPDLAIRKPWWRRLVGQ